MGTCSNAITCGKSVSLWVGVMHPFSGVNRSEAPAPSTNALLSGREMSQGLWVDIFKNIFGLFGLSLYQERIRISIVAMGRPIVSGPSL